MMVIISELGLTTLLIQLPSIFKSKIVEGSHEL